MSTQLRLVEPPAPTSPRNVRATAARSTGNPGPRARRAVNWGDWRLDARTRRVGRAGVARARRALEEAAATDELSQAS